MTNPPALTKRSSIFASANPSRYSFVKVDSGFLFSASRAIDGFPSKAQCPLREFLQATYFSFFFLMYLMLFESISLQKSLLSSLCALSFLPFVLGCSTVECISFIPRFSQKARTILHFPSVPLKENARLFGLFV